jgi:hypothetical protein
MFLNFQQIKTEKTTLPLQTSTSIIKRKYLNVLIQQIVFLLISSQDKISKCLDDIT